VQVFTSTRGAMVMIGGKVLYGDKSIQAAAWLAIAFGALLPVLRVVVVIAMALMAGR